MDELIWWSNGDVNGNFKDENERRRRREKEKMRKNWKDWNTFESLLLENVFGTAIK